jgi:hypothetical protein
VGWNQVLYIVGYIIQADERFTEVIKNVTWPCMALGIIDCAVQGTFIFVLNYNFANLHHSGDEPFSLIYVLFNSALSVAGWSWVVFILRLATKKPIYKGTSPLIL